MVPPIFFSIMQWWAEAMNDDINALIDTILREGTRIADEAEVFFIQGTSVSAELKRTIIGEATSVKVCAMGIRTIKDGRIGVSSTNDPDRWRQCLHSAVESAGFASPQEWHGLPTQAEFVPQVSIFDPAITPGVGDVSDLLTQMLEGAASHDADVVGGTASLSTSTLTLANSNGLLYSRNKTHAGVSLEAISGTSTGYEFDRSCFLADIDARRVGEQATFWASHGVNGEHIPTGRYDVIFSPLAIAQLIGNVVIPALSGRNVNAGRSYLAPFLGRQCMDECLNIYDDPFARATGSTPWDAEGVLTRRLDFIEEGVLNCFAYDLKTAYRYGAESTGSAVRGGAGGAPSIGVHTLVIDGPRSETHKERGLYVNDLIGAHTANSISGDFSVELTNPTWVENASFQEPVRSAMISGNVFEMLKNVGGIGKESRLLGNAIIPPVRFNNIQIIGK
jgi:PmbA protein